MLKFYTPTSRVNRMSISYRVRDSVSNQNGLQEQIEFDMVKDTALKDDINLTIILEDIKKEVLIYMLYIFDLFK